MATNLFSFIDLFARSVVTTRHLLGRGAAHLAETGGDPEAMLGWRLADDMHPLAFQVSIVANFTRMWPARVAGLEPPPAIAPDLDLAGLNAVLDDALAYLRALPPEPFAARDEEPLTFELMPGMSPTLPAGKWLTVFAATNITFHVDMTYAILRSRGVPLGKIDMFPAGLG